MNYKWNVNLNYQSYWEVSNVNTTNQLDPSNKIRGRTPGKMCNYCNRVNHVATQCMVWERDQRNQQSMKDLIDIRIPTKIMTTDQISTNIIMTEDITKEDIAQEENPTKTNNPAKRRPPLQ